MISARIIGDTNRTYLYTKWMMMFKSQSFQSFPQKKEMRHCHVTHRSCLATVCLWAYREGINSSFRTSLYI